MRRLLTIAVVPSALFLAGCMTDGAESQSASASATPGQPTAAFSSSIELIHSPPDLITSLARSVICMLPSGWRIATSPVSNQPSPSVASLSSLK